MSERVKVFTTENGLPEFPGGRFRNEGPNSGEEFRDDHLVPALKDEKRYDRVQVIFDGVAGFGSSFLEEAFGGLVRKHRLSRECLGARLDISAGEDDLLDYVERAREYIKKALHAASAKHA